jgi:DMSO/TMAO reductase YedYZ molybdopterin-dependent catalytic subunit
MKLKVTRRQALAAGLASVGGVVLGPKTLPPTYGNLLRMGDNLTYLAHRVLLPQQALVREYSESDITSFPAIGTTDPGASGTPERARDYSRMDVGAFADWRLSVEGLVARPRTFSMAELKALPSRTQITRHTCEEGWSAIAKWTGVPLGAVLDAAGILPTARFVVSYSYDDFANSVDMLDAFHPQTILAYGMNGRELSVPHGAPLRLRVERQLGYKGLKYLQRLVVTNEFDDGGQKGDLANGWAWYTGI